MGMTKREELIEKLDAVNKELPGCVSNWYPECCQFNVLVSVMEVSTAIEVGEKPDRELILRRFIQVLDIRKRELEGMLK